MNGLVVYQLDHWSRHLDVYHLWRVSHRVMMLGEDLRHISTQSHFYLTWSTVT